MSRETVLILIGLLVALSPFVGVPLHILAWVLPVLGALVILVGVSLRSRRRAERKAASPDPAVFG